MESDKNESALNNLQFFQQNEWENFSENNWFSPKTKNFPIDDQEVATVNLG